MENWKTLQIFRCGHYYFFANLQSSDKLKKIKKPVHEFADFFRRAKKKKWKEDYKVGRISCLMIARVCAGLIFTEAKKAVASMPFRLWSLPMVSLKCSCRN